MTKVAICAVSALAVLVGSKVVAGHDGVPPAWLYGVLLTPLVVVAFGAWRKRNTGATVKGG